MSGELFVRKSSGLVREISAKDALVYNILIMAPTAVYVYGVWAMLLFPGVHLPTTALIAMALSIVQGLFFAYMSAILPRTGGDYVWISRFLHPALGFTMNFFLFNVLMAVAGSYIPWFTQYAMNPLLNYLGMEDMAAFVVTNEFMFGFAVVYYIVIALTMIWGVKISRVLFWGFFLGAIIGFLVYASVLLSAGPATFEANFNSKFGLDLGELVTQALDMGMPSTFLIGATLAGTMFTILNFLGFNSSVYISGEIKNVRRAQLYSIIGAVVLFGVLTWAVYQVTYMGYGAENLAALSYLLGTDQYPLDFEPFFHVLLQVFNPSPLVYTIVVVGWSLMVLGAIYVYVFTCVRLLFAWAFDRVVPTWFAEVNARTGAPVNAVITSAIIAIIFQALWLFTPLLNYFAFIVLGWGIMAAVASLTGFAVARRSDLLEAAPEFAKAKVGSVPVVAVLAFASLLISIFMAYVGTIPAVVGEIVPEYVAFLVGLYILGFVIYYASYAYHKSKGIPLDMVFKQLPPE